MTVCLTLGDLSERTTKESASGGRKLNPERKCQKKKKERKRKCLSLSVLAKTDLIKRSCLPQKHTTVEFCDKRQKSDLTSAEMICHGLEKHTSPAKHALKIVKPIVYMIPKRTVTKGMLLLPKDC